MNNDRAPKRPTARAAAEAVFSKPAAPKAEPAPRPPVIPGARELVSLRLDQEVLAHFQEQGPGWQERVNQVLRKAAGL